VVTGAAPVRLADTRPRAWWGPRAHLAATHPPPLVRHLGVEDPWHRHPRRATAGSHTSASRTRPGHRRSRLSAGSTLSRQGRWRPTRS